MTTASDAHAHFTLADFASEDMPMRACLELARVASRTDLPVLLLGESGTGKTLLARAIHNTSARARAPFVSFNAAALSDTLLDSQLFGHERGAYTGAVRGLKGKFELAHTGTLFIDEIADMSATAQAKILRAVEYGEFERLGSETLRVADVRLVSATHLPLHRYLQTEHFRRDLFYRISGITISIPPLRNRPADLRALIAAEVAAASRAQGKPIIGLSKRALEALLAHDWPGNLRELKRVIHSSIAMTAGDVILPEALHLETGQAGYGAASASGRVALPGQAGTTGEHRADRRAESRGSALADPDSTDLTLRTAEQQHIRKVLAMMRGNKRRSARALGLSRSTLDRKLAELAIAPGSPTAVAVPEERLHSAAPRSLETQP